MCYQGSCFISKKVRFAKRNIKVFKFALEAPGGKVVPYFFSRKISCYEEGKEYTSKIHCFYEGFGNDLIIDEGLHSYNKKLCWYKKDSHFINMHSLFLSPAMYFDIRDGLLKLDCHIPKGSKYYINCSGEMVSDKLVVDKIQKLNG